MLILVDLSFILKFVRVKLAVEFLDLLLLLSENFELGSLLLRTLVRLTRQFILNFFELALVLIDNLAHFGDFLLLLLDFGVVLLDAVHQALASLGERQIHFVSLEFQIFFALQEMGLLVAQMLGTLLQSVLAEDTLSMSQLSVDVLEFLTGLLNFTQELLIISLVFLVIIALLGVQVVKLSFVSEVDFLDLLFV